MAQGNTLEEAARIVQTAADTFRDRNTIFQGTFYDWMDDHNAHATHQHMLRVAAGLKKMDHEQRSRGLFASIVIGICGGVAGALLAAIFSALLIVAMNDPIEPDQPHMTASPAAMADPR